jgi:hypothetical protein
MNNTIKYKNNNIVVNTPLNKRNIKTPDAPTKTKIAKDYEGTFKKKLEF